MIDRKKWLAAGVPAEWIAIIAEASRVSGRPPRQGTPGRGIASVAVDEDTAEITITLTDGTIVETGPLRAPYTPYASYADFIASSVPAPVAVAAAVVDGVVVRWRRDAAGAVGPTADGGMWTPAETPQTQHYNNVLATAVTATASGTIEVDYDEQTLPADFSGRVLEYTGQATAQNITQSGFLPDQALRTFRAQLPAGHSGVKWSALNVEALASGSGANGPNSSDYGATINVAKQGYASGTAQPGEIDGLTIYVRQDGTRGLPLGDGLSSDACGILINVQNVEDVGFVAPIEATSSNIEGASPFGYRYRIQAQMAPITPNAPGGPISYGHVVVAKDGANNHAYYASAEGTATWANILHSPQRVSVTWDGEYRIITPDWALGAARFTRGRGENDALQIINRGTGGVLINAQEAADIMFSTSGTIRFRVQSNGTVRPEVNLGSNFGTPTFRWAGGFFGGVDASGIVNMTNASISMTDLPVYADNAAALSGGLTAGRVYRTATGQIMVTY